MKESVGNPNRRMALDGLDGNLLIARSQSKSSPPSLLVSTAILIATALNQKIIADAVDAGIKFTEEFLIEKGTEALGILGRDKKAAHENLFPFLGNADYLIPLLYPRKEYVDSISMAKKIAPSTTGVFQRLARIMPFISPKEPVYAPSEVLTVDWSKNLCSIGGPLINNCSGLMMGCSHQDDLKELGLNRPPTFPFIFNFNLEGRFDCKLSEEKIIDIIRTKYFGTEEIINYSIATEGKDLYVPLFDPNTKKYIRDYGIVIKMKSLLRGGMHRGFKYMLFMGCHGGGTLGTGQLISEAKLLQKIENEVGDHDFQAVVSVVLDKNEKPKRVKLAELVDLSG